ncbi:hypothetical protein GCM10008090_24260 [Arenicella chitinivorans]|uniref:SWIM-type domain-containing protein n=1 Tax=Arenicella chitinivorans TaxID=1329800 RepID=A0A918RWB2_9GAMM|nr:hypothetical protein [Arenicella chitinivorans]GHA13675.1 hypothetical protein GCM10008090_24260 [Arenicella chitinivorans]
MKALSEQTFKTLAGDAAFQQGHHFYTQGLVHGLQIHQDRITAQLGTEPPFAVELRHTARVFEGSCGCPESAGFDFCAHCVATALAYYYTTQTNQELSEVPSDDLLRRYLDTLTKPQLATALYDFLESHPDILAHWQLKASIASGQLSFSEIRKQITRALPYRSGGLWRPKDVNAYFSTAADLLRMLSEPVLALPPEKIDKLLTYTLERLEKALKNIDDTADKRQIVIVLLRTWLRAMLASNTWSDDDKISFLSEHLRAQSFAAQTLDLPESVDDLISSDAATKVYSQITRYWESLSPPGHAFSDQGTHYHYVEQLLINRARQLGDTELEFDVLVKGATTVDRCLQLVDWLLKHQDFSQAEKWLHVAGHFDEPDARELQDIELMQVKLWKAQGNFQAALAAEVARFDEDEDLDTILNAIETATHLDLSEQVRDQAIQTLQARLREGDSSLRNRRRADTLVQLFLNSHQVAPAVELAKRTPLSNQSLKQIIVASHQHHSPAVSLILDLTQRLIDTDTDRQYQRVEHFIRNQMRVIDQAKKSTFADSIRALADKPENKRRPGLLAKLNAAL